MSGLLYTQSGSPITKQQYYENESNLGNYQFTPLNRLIQQFMIAYVGEGKIISKVSITDVQFHAMRALQEFSFDTFKSCKSQEYKVPNSLTMPLPQDYVNYTKISSVDSSGIKHILYPAKETSNPTKYQQSDDGDFLFDANGDLIKSGNLLSNSFNSNLQAGVGNIVLNALLGGAAQSTNTASGTVSDPITNSIGWFFDNNAIIGYNLPEDQEFYVKNIPIHSGEKYTITYTLSGYSSGTYAWRIIDENGDFKDSTSVSANGTYSHEIDLSTGVTEAQLSSRSITFSQTSSTAGNVTIDNISLVRVGDEEDSLTWSNYKSLTPSENNNDDYEDDVYWPYEGERYGLEPSHAQTNGSFYIDCKVGKIHFSSNMSGQTIVLDYLSDTVGTDEEMQVHKFAEEAMYKWILYAILSTKAGIPEYIVRRYKKERFAETRKAKLRLSNIKLEEITQVLRGKSKQIKH